MRGSWLGWVVSAGLGALAPALVWAGQDVTPAAQGQSSAERAFSAARAWTVQVEVAVSQAFIEDEQGFSEGSGIVVDPERGWVLTNAHVASHSPALVKVAFDDGRRLPVERVYVDPYLDLAIIAYDPGRVQHAVPTPALECDAVPGVGHPVGAYGHPWGYLFTGTRGIASGVTSKLGPDMLQTDAPVNAGNSGGALISLESGRVVGVNAATIDKSEAEGLSFAVPMPYACTLLELLEAGRDPSPPHPALEFAFDENGEATTVVSSNRLPAGTLPLESGDRVVEVDGRLVDTPTEFYDAVRGRLDRLSVKVERHGEGLTLEGALPPAPQVTRRRGLLVGGALFASAEEFEGGVLAVGARLMVHNVDAASQASAVDLQVFDLLVRADGEPVESLEALEALFQEAARTEQSVSLLLLRFASGKRLVEYQQRQFEPAELERVGPW